MRAISTGYLVAEFAGIPKGSVGIPANSATRWSVTLMNLLVDFAVEAGLAQGFENGAAFQARAFDDDGALRAFAFKRHRRIFEQVLDGRGAHAAAGVDILDGDFVGLIALFVGGVDLEFLAVSGGGAEKAAGHQGLDAGVGRGGVLRLESNGLGLR